MPGNKSVTLDLLGRNEDAKRKIAQIREEYERLKAEVDAGNLDISPAALKRQQDAQIRAVTKDLFNYAAENKKAEEQNKKTESSLKGLGAAFADLFTGGLTGGKPWAEMNLFNKAMLGASAATGLGEPIIAAAGVAVLGLSSSLVAAGAGLGVFGLAAKSAFSQVEAANAKNKVLTGGLGELQSELKTVTAEWSGFGKNNAGGVAGVFGNALRLVPEALKAMQPFLAPTEKALNSLIDSMAKIGDSKGFMRGIQEFAKASGPDLANIGKSLGNVVAGLVGVFKAFLPIGGSMSKGLEDITGKFAKWGETLGDKSGFHSFVEEGISKGPQVVEVFKNLAGFVKNFLSASAGVTIFANSQVLWNILTPVSQLLNVLSGNKALMQFGLYMLAAYESGKKFSSGINGLSAVSKSLTGIITSLATKFGILKAAQVEAAAGQEGVNVAMDANPIGAIILGLTLLVAGFVYLWDHFKGFRDFWKDAWKDIREAFDVSRHFIAKGFDDVRHNIAAFAHDFASYFDEVRGNIHRWYSDVMNFGGRVISWFGALPKRIWNALGDFGRLLIDAGKSLIDGLMHGIDNAAGALWDKVTGIGRRISGVFKSVMGIFSPSKVFADHGKNLVLGLVSGISGNASLAEGAIRDLAQRAVNASSARFPGTATAGANAGYLQAEWIGGAGSDAEFITWLKKNIRIRGGDPSVLGR